MEKDQIFREKLEFGRIAVFPYDSSDEPYAVVFEDDGETGYWYAGAVDENGSAEILDAVQLYVVKDLGDPVEPAEIVMKWSATGRQAIILINDIPQAIYDFENQQAYCRSGFPEPDGNGWCKNDHQWSESALSFFS
jgi:hypothetical protein